MSIKSQLKRMMMENQGKEADSFSSMFQPPKDPWDEMAWWEKGLDVLSRPNYASANVAKALLTGQNPFQAAARGITGQDRTTYSDVLKLTGMDPGLARGVLGFRRRHSRPHNLRHVRRGRRS